MKHLTRFMSGIGQQTFDTTHARELIVSERSERRCIKFINNKDDIIREKQLAHARMQRIREDSLEKFLIEYQGGLIVLDNLRAYIEWFKQDKYLADKYAIRLHEVVRREGVGRNTLSECRVNLHRKLYEIRKEVETNA